MSRPHENDENDVSFSMKTQTFENNWSCDLCQRISTENVLLFFIGISLLIVNWQLNVYDHKFK